MVTVLHGVSETQREKPGAFIESALYRMRNNSIKKFRSVPDTYSQSKWRFATGSRKEKMLPGGGGTPPAVSRNLSLDGKS
jgi:hypothetical protein